MPAIPFHIARIAINAHHKMYDELAATLADGLGELGHPCSAGLNELRPGWVNIVLGSTIFTARGGELGRGLQGVTYVLYQLEQLDDRRGLLKEYPDYRAILAGAAGIWDYAPSSSAWLRERGFANVATLPPGYHPSLETIRRAPQPDIDIVFVGSPHPRRQRILDGLRQVGLWVVHLDGVYGELRNRTLARAKLVLNIHAWDDLDALETVRLSLLLANRCFIVSEKADHDPYDKGVMFARYDELVETCLYWLRQSPARRAAIAERGYQALRTQSMTAVLRALI
jgi:hypothetical protein